MLLAAHGTSVASVAGGRFVGLAPDAKIVSVYGGINLRSWNESLDGIVKHAFEPSTPPFRTGIINLSASITGIDDSELAAFDERIRRMTTGIDANGNADPNGKRFLFVFAAGNAPEGCTATGDVRYRPNILGAQMEGVVTVAGITRHNVLWASSCRGALVEVAAPAEDVFVASLGGTDHYRFEPAFYNSGTSWAAPFVSGIAAQYLELDPTLTPAQLEARLKASPSRADGLPVPIVPASPYPKRRAVR
jgi:subtilisin family serine protease